jgi:ATP-binding cassette subfamily B protein
MFFKIKRKLSDYFKSTAHFQKVAKSQKKQLLLAFISGVGYTIMGILEPWPLKLIFDTLFYKEPFPKALNFLSSYDSFFLLNLFVLAIVFLALSRGLCYYYQQLLIARAGQQIVSKIRLKLFGHLQQLSLNFHNKRKTGDILSRLTVDIKTLRQALVSLPLTFATDCMLMTAMISVMMLMDFKLALVALTIVPLLYLLMRKYKSPMKKAIKEQREKEGSLTSFATETLQGIHLVQSYQQEERGENIFSTEEKSTLRSGLKASRIEAKLKWASELSVAFITALIFFIAGRDVLNGVITPGDLLVFTFYLKMFNRPLRRLSKLTEQIARGSNASERISEILQISPSVYDFPNSKDKDILHGKITFENVVLSYNKNGVALDGISLEIEPGEKIAIVGKTGSGKSTLVSLIPRFWDPTSGCVKIDDQDLRSFTLKSLRKQISMVFQEPLLFAASVKENIAYGKPNATCEEIEEAAKKVGIHEMILSLEEGYDTIISERGTNLSGGQRQCIAIARAMMKEASIIILDEPTSGLDKESAKMVLSALLPLIEDKTCLLITHHREILPGIERIITLKKGKVWTKPLTEPSELPVTELV